MCMMCRRECVLVFCVSMYSDILGHSRVSQPLNRLESALLSMTTTDGSSCLFVSVQLGYPLITRPLLKAGGRELLVIAS
jgi:hypothetical protein